VHGIVQPTVGARRKVDVPTPDFCTYARQDRDVKPANVDWSAPCSPKSGVMRTFASALGRWPRRGPKRLKFMTIKAVQFDSYGGIDVPLEVAPECPAHVFRESPVEVLARSGAAGIQISVEAADFGAGCRAGLFPATFPLRAGAGTGAGVVGRTRLRRHRVFASATRLIGFSMRQVSHAEIRLPVRQNQLDRQ